MVSICFAGTYKPIVCGIADYTDFIIRKSPARRWGVLSFDLRDFGCEQNTYEGLFPDQTWYGIPGRSNFSAAKIHEGMRKLGNTKGETVVWFQHETAIWADNDKFIKMLKNLGTPKVVTFHTLHFQSNDTPYGLRQDQFNLLQYLLPQVEAITVFSNGVYRAVTSAFPNYVDKVHVIEHGIHSYPEISRLSRNIAKEEINDFLLYESDLDKATKEALHKERIFSDPDTVVIGQTGFLCPLKHSEVLYNMCDNLQGVLPGKRVVAMRIGSSRDQSQQAYVERLRAKLNIQDRFLLETWLPQNKLALVQRAFDVNFYWPSECTQSGILAHALGANAIVAGRDMEGLGEILKQSGEITDTDLGHLLLKIRDLILNPETGKRIEENVLKYATKYNWENQAQRHYELANKLLQPTQLRPQQSNRGTTLPTLTTN